MDRRTDRRHDPDIELLIRHDNPLPAAAERPFQTTFPLPPEG
ncbi:MAG: hypothetical protein ACKV2U_31610 [Bryobacteraceae bacterium]